MTLGIDIGSTTVKYVVCDAHFSIHAKDYTAHDTHQAKTLLRLLEALQVRQPDLYMSIDKAYITGSGATRIAPALHARFVQEVNAVVLAVEHLHPDVRSVVELGGQDAKIIHIKEHEDGSRNVLTSMNDKCASGTGATIEKCTMKVGLEPEELTQIAFRDDALHHVAAKCGVFAETDVVNLVKSSVPSDEIMNSLADAIVMQNLTVLTRGNTLMPHVLLLGGPNAYLPFLQAAWRRRIAQLWDEREIAYDPEKLESLIHVPENALYYAALGAVIFGQGESVAPEPYNGIDGLRALIAGGTDADNPYRDTPLVRDEKELADFQARYALAPFVPRRPDKPMRCFLGIDGGSTSSKAVLIDESGSVLFKAYQLSGGNPIQDTIDLLSHITAFDPEGHFRIDGLGVTGYAADVLEGALRADANIVETIAHMKSAQAIFGQSVDVICDVGGQDIKVLFLENGMMKNFRLSNQCSAGNGMLLQSMAKQFGVPIEQFAPIAFGATEAPKFNYGCAVFLDTDRVTFQKEGYPKEALFAGMAKVLPKNIWQYVVQAPSLGALGRHFVLQGGTQYNQAALKAQVDYIRTEVPDAQIDVHPHCGEAGAIGAALEARDRVKRNKQSTFVGLAEALRMTYVTRTDESTRCHFCPNDCSRTFIDTQTPSGNATRYIAGFKCEKGTVESRDELLALRKRRKSLHAHTPNLVHDESILLFDAGYALPPIPSENTPVNDEEVRITLGGWGPTLRRRVRRTFVRSSQQARAKRRSLTVAIPRALNVYSISPFLRTYLEALGVEPSRILFSDFSSEEMFLEGAKYGSVDACYPAKVAQAHVHQLLFGKKFVRKAIDIVWFPAVVTVESFLHHTMASKACPVVIGTPRVVYSAFTKERDLFARAGVDYIDESVNMDDANLLTHQLFQTWGKRLEITPDENRWAVEQGLAALEHARDTLAQRGREILNEAERKGEVVLLLLGRSYHSDPGLNHDVLDRFQEMGFKSLSINALPKDPDYLEQLFGQEVHDGIIEDVYDIRDVWPENYSTHSAQKVWAAKFAARHPNIAVVDLSSFKCGHDAPTYAIIDRILGASRTPHLTLHDIDANKPDGSIAIRVKTFAYALEEYRRTLGGGADV
jgi:activator of 2-hydroxyglutaryl-CoA dehydratase/predicted nucleotide-binding protein (sugar kinase/HSP70/actin superfamily)